MALAIAAKIDVEGNCNIKSPTNEPRASFDSGLLTVNLTSTLVDTHTLMDNRPRDCPKTARTEPERDTLDPEESTISPFPAAKTSSTATAVFQNTRLY